jgi:[acyl-carrier-protein] S-malonyltransferase
MPERIAFVFPGQGSQAVGMGAELYAASEAAHTVFAAADEALGFSLSTLCFNGPEDALRETSNAQPAITTVSLAALAALRVALGASGTTAAELVSGPPWPAYMAGHSVGEYTALIATGAVSFADGLRLVRERGRLMGHEGTECAGGMAAVLGMDADALVSVCAQAEAEVAADPALPAHPGAGKVVVANDNAPGQVVLSGERIALDRAMELARAAGAKRVVPLQVSGAFHSPVMAPAAPALATAIDVAHLADATVPIVANITALPITSAAELRTELAGQIAASVQWTRSMQWLAETAGVTTFVELGVGQVLAGLIKRIAKGATVLNVGTSAEATATAEALREQGFGTNE